MSVFPSSINFKLPTWTIVLVLFCAAYTGIWGAVMLANPSGYFAFSQLTPSHFPPSIPFWGWFGISGGLFYGLYPLVYRKAPGYALGGALFSLGGVSVTLYMLFGGPLTLEMGAIHLAGDTAGLLGFGTAAWLDYAARRKRRVGRLLKTMDGESREGEDWATLAREYHTQSGSSLKEISDKREVLVVFLRHFGCTFCKEALGDLQRQREKIEAAGKVIVLVHMSDEATAAKQVWKYDLADIHRISDPEKRLYEAFELKRGSFGQLFGLPVLVEYVRSGLLKGNFIGKYQGNGFQMPGAFLIHKGRLRRSFVHETVADRPDYCILGDCYANQDAELSYS